MTIATHVVSGMLAMGYAVAALFFLRFWRESRDRLFAFFAGGFALLSIQRVGVAFIQPAELLYAIRLAAFLVIAYAIIEKNRHVTGR